MEMSCEETKTLDLGGDVPKLRQGLVKLCKLKSG